MNNEIYMAGPSVTQADEAIVLDALRNGWYGKNAYKYVELFEAEFAKYHNRAYALMTPNCTSAIHLLLKGLNIHEGDEVIVPECTWIAIKIQHLCIARFLRFDVFVGEIDAAHRGVIAARVQAVKRFLF